MDKEKIEQTMGNFTIRQLDESETHLYKAIRLEAIQTEPAMFRCSIPAEADLTDFEWQQRMTYPRAVFGLFDGDTLIGMTSILLLSKEEGYLGQSYLRREYRNRGLSSLFYEVRMALARKLGLKQLSVSHRESNVISKAANQRHGFNYTHREAANWLDGTTEHVLYYVLELQ